jgi:hypothetical protein
MLSPEREKAYLDILERAVLNMRALAARRDVEQIAVEANHVHNLPALVRNSGDADAEQAYWNIARAAYLRDSKPGWPSAFGAMWEALDPQHAPRGATAGATQAKAS